VIPSGELAWDDFLRIAGGIQNDTMLVALSLQGEPFLNRDLCRMIGYFSGKKIATLTATNGSLLTPAVQAELAGSGLDILKVAVSGFSQDIYARYHRGGSIEIVKKNLADLKQRVSEAGNRTLIIVDYILFGHNGHELDLMERFCRQHGLALSVRTGFIPGSYDAYGNPAPARKEPSKKTCKWPWHISVINFDGAIFPCCSSAYSSNPCILENALRTPLSGAWNSGAYTGYRLKHFKEGRAALVICRDCACEDIGFEPTRLLYAGD
jgi:MoaA/NifB/PqqE/SkfB family radical SAM enzyme